MQAGETGNAGAGHEPASSAVVADDLAAATANYLEQARAILRGGGAAGGGRSSGEGAGQPGAASTGSGGSSRRRGGSEDAGSSARSSRDRRPSLRRLATANYLEQARAVVGASAQHAEGGSSSDGSDASAAPLHLKPSFHHRRESAYSSNELLEQARAAVRANTPPTCPPNSAAMPPPPPGSSEAPPLPSSLPSTSATGFGHADFGGAHCSSRRWGHSGSVRTSSLASSAIESRPAGDGSGGGGRERIPGCALEANGREGTSDVAISSGRSCEPGDSAFGGLAGAAGVQRHEEIDSAHLYMMTEEGEPSTAVNDLYELD
ncbi:hypothetical protein DUNSADRAFT_2638 [Dunaliella salina]|uniref:Uncharacterized protein n=1 Tax=Dunaliella salina TaxID=3046 RepID=A0ABQ7FW33_DUNSA|nr:hypothetical protein DUNSADRAFT_2638 [Dunaliella salina]|eukprot:KAF5826581.1 hypothetical protein DUNSADRAFT_2638 [Dunaliella salina]